MGRFRKCCCCISLRNATLFIAVLTSVCSVADLTGRAVELLSLDPTCSAAVWEIAALRRLGIGLDSAVDQGCLSGGITRSGSGGSVSDSIWDEGGGSVMDVIRDGDRAVAGGFRGREYWDVRPYLVASMVVSSIWAGAGFSLFAGTLRERASWLTPWLLVDSVLILLTTVFGAVGIGGLCYSGRYQVAATFAFVISFTFMVSVYMKLVVWSYYCELRERRYSTQLPERV